MFLMMPETKGVPLEMIEYIFLCPKEEGCVIRRDPRGAVTDIVDTVKRHVDTVKRVSGAAMVRRGGYGGKTVLREPVMNELRARQRPRE